MDLWQLNVFCKVIELKSFSKAGKAVHLSQPTVSSHIKDLEDHIGCRLVDRLSREVVPTKAGELLYTYARRLVALRDEAEIALSEFQGNIKGNLIIGGSTIPGGYLLPHIVGAFTRRYPEVRVSLIIGDTEKIINDTHTGDIEVGVVGARTDNKNIVQEKLLEDEMRLILPAGHKWTGRKQVTLNMLLSEPFIAREKGSGTLKSIRESLFRRGKSIDELNIISEMGSTQAVIQGIKGLAGISILSVISVADELRAGTLVAMPVTELDLKRHFYLTRHRYRTHSPLCRTFIDFIREYLNLHF